MGARRCRAARDAGAVAVRAYPPQWQLGPHDAAMQELAIACGEAKLPLVLTVRVRGPAPAAPARRGRRSRRRSDPVARASGADARLVVTAAGREMIEEVHWGLTPAEQERVLWDISWIWGPPEDHLAKLFRTIGSRRFVYGTQWPLRLTQAPRANLDLLPDDLVERTAGRSRRVLSRMRARAAPAVPFPARLRDGAPLGRGPRTRIRRSGRGARARPARPDDARGEVLAALDGARATSTAVPRCTGTACSGSRCAIKPARTAAAIRAPRRGAWRRS